jgi:hypothetical protein
MRKYIFSLALLISFSSCISSLHQLVTYDTVITDNRITGQWEQNDNTAFTIEELLKSNLFKSTSATTVNGKQQNSGFDSKEDSLLYSKSYVLNFTKSGYNYTMITSLMRLNNELYADCLPASAVTSIFGKPENVFVGTAYLPSHTFAKIIFNGPSMKIKFLNGDFIKSQMTKGTMAVKYEIDNLFNTSLITASSAELQQLILKYGNDERLYSPENTITLTKI